MPNTIHSGSAGTLGRSLDWFIPIVLISIVFVIYGQVQGFQFVNYDDNLYVTANSHVKAGLSFSAVRWAFTTGHASNWHPITWLSHLLDVTLFGENAGWHHLVNVLFHAANACLVFLLLRWMTAQTWPSAFVAALFAVHPLHVESVAWVAERKDVLSTLFWLLAMIAYVRYTRRNSASAYVAALLFFSMGLMAKPMLVTLPAVLLLMDYWPLERLSGTRARRVIIEKLPFFVMAAASCVVTFWVQRSGHSVTAIDALPVGLRVENAVVSYGRYILMTVWPVRLAAFYPHPGPGLSIWSVIISGVFIVAVSIGVVAARRTRPYLLIGWLWYLGTLIPVIGLVQVGAQALADRYTYVPLIGLFIMAAWGVQGMGWLTRSRKGALLAGIPASGILVIFSVLAMIQTQYWRDSAALFGHALRVTSGNYLAHKNLGVALAEKKRYAQAADEYIKGIRAKGNDPDLYYDLANAFAEMGRPGDAVAQYRKAIAIKPDHTEAHYNLANALARQGQFDAALAEYGAVLKSDPAHLGALVNTGNTLAMLHRPAEAMPRYQEALQIDPGNEEALTNLGNVLVEQGKFDEAVPYYVRSVERNPRNIDAYGNMGFALMKLGRTDEAAKAFARVLNLDPGNARARDSLRAIDAARENASAK